MISIKPKKHNDLRLSVYQKKLNKFSWSIIRFIIIIGLGYVFMFPILYMISIAFRSPELINDPSVIWIPRSLSLQSIKETMELMDYKNSISKSLIISITSTVCTVISCAFVGYGFARFDFYEKKLAFALVILTIIVPPQMTLISSYTNFRHFSLFGIMDIASIFTNEPISVNLLDTPWTFILPSIFASGLRGGFFIFIYRSFFTGMPKELEEAANIDGCGPLKTFFSVMLPLAKPSIIIVLLFSLVWHWNDITLSSMYYMNEMPLSVMLSNLKTLIGNTGIKIVSEDMVRTYMQAGCLLTITPPLILFIIAQKQFTESIERSGIVG